MSARPFETGSACITLADHAEAWQWERGGVVPGRGTPEWAAMYEEWAEWAFEDFGVDSSIGSTR